ncbi:MAG: hypothetical protein VCA38_00200 [Roseibacillus sp.]
MKSTHHHSTALAQPVRWIRLSGKGLALSLALVLITQSVSAESPRASQRQGPPPGVRVEFLVAGSPLPREQSRRGGDAFVVVPRWGIEYEIQIQNCESRDRVLFVIGVDGLSVMNGRPASQQSGGYVLDPGETARIRGWRRSNQRVAAFTFTGSEDSYASRTGQSGHIGEISIWAIREKSVRPPVEITPSHAAEQTRRKGNRARGRALHSEGETGTGYGDELVDHVRPTEFVRSDSIRCLTYRYGLRRLVKPYRDLRPARGDSEQEQSFTPPPPGWQRRRLGRK